MTPVGHSRDVGAVVGRDLAVEAAGRDMAVSVVPFSVAAVLLVGLGAGVGPAILVAVAPTITWLVVLLAAVPIATVLVSQEQEDGCWDLLRGLVPTSSLLIGKVAAAWSLLAAVWAFTAVLVAVFYNAAPPAVAFAAAALGTLGVATVTVLFAVLTAGSARRPGVLSILMLPAALPVLLAGVQTAAAPEAAQAWMAFLAAYDLVMLALAWAVFPVLMEE